MPITVPRLDNQVFTPGPARDYVGHALQIAQQFPDYAKMLREGQAAEMQRRAALLKYQTDLQKAQEFLDLYGPYRNAQIAKLNAEAARANAIADTMPSYRESQVLLNQERANSLKGYTPEQIELIMRGMDPNAKTSGTPQSTPGAGTLNFMTGEGIPTESAPVSPRRTDVPRPEVEIQSPLE